MASLFRTARMASLFLAFAFSVIGLSTGINGLVKSDHQKRAVREAVPSGVSVTINNHDVLSSGIVITVLCGLLAFVAFVSLVSSFFPRAAASRPVHLAQGALLAFLTTWLFATIIPFTDFVANRSARVSATLGGVPLPQSIIQQTQQALGVTNVYHKLHYLRIATAFPWIAFLFGATSAAFEFAAISRLATQYPVARDRSTEKMEERAAESA